MALTMQTKNDLGDAVALELVPLLNASLADAVDLLTQAKQAHWNVKGPGFIGLHLLFDQVAGAMYECADTIAERAVQLGGVAEGTARQVARGSTLAAYPDATFTGAEHCTALSGALAAFASTLRRGITQANELDDAGTADMFTQLSRDVDKWLWFVEAHLQTGI